MSNIFRPIRFLTETWAPGLHVMIRRRISIFNVEESHSFKPPWGGFYPFFFFFFFFFFDMYDIGPLNFRDRMSHFNYLHQFGH
jgi:hypothetical protein